MTVLVSELREGNIASRTHSAALLLRYPALDPGELGELIAFYREAPAIDIALLTCEDGLRPKIAQFERDHRRRIKRWRDISATLAVYGFFSVILLIAVAINLS